MAMAQDEAYGNDSYILAAQRCPNVRSTQSLHGPGKTPAVALGVRFAQGFGAAGIR